MFTAIHTILYVADQEASTRFWTAALAMRPSLHAAGMTEYQLDSRTVLGLMPAAGIKRLLGDLLPDPERAPETPRAELYLRVDDPTSAHKRAIQAGARELSSVQPREWGDRVGYLLTPDGHVLAFAAPHPVGAP